MGFSVVSIIEIIYFLTIRPYCASRKKNLQQNNKKPNNRNKMAAKKWRQRNIIPHEPILAIDEILQSGRTATLKYYKYSYNESQYPFVH